MNSNSGTDSLTCGVTPDFPCKTLAYTIGNLATNSNTTVFLQSNITEETVNLNQLVGKVSILPDNSTTSAIFLVGSSYTASSTGIYMHKILHFFPDFFSKYYYFFHTFSSLFTLK